MLQQPNTLNRLTARVMMLEGTMHRLERQLHALAHALEHTAKGGLLTAQAGQELVDRLAVLEARGKP